MSKKDKINLINSVKVIVSPWQSGFHCGIIMDSKSKMTTEEYELCSTIARGMIKMATSDPHSTFLWGLRGFADDKKKSSKDLTISSVADFDDESNVIDFLEFLKQKRDKELN
tara:strand:- start:383 stop:718 length:336 start_codon:yes stop_codon:yes gene_type:complete